MSSIVLRRAVDRLSLWLAGAGAVAIFILMAIMVSDALARKIVRPVPGAFEVSIGLMVLIMFLPQGFAQLRRANVAVDIISSRLPPKLAAGIQVVAALLGVGLFGLLAYLSWDKAWQATVVGELSSGIVNFPVWPFRWFMPLGSAVLVLQFIETAIDEFDKVIRKQ